MNKTQRRDAQQARAAVRAGMPDMAARILSASIRAALRDSDAGELHDVALELGVTGEADYIVQVLA
jgi:hypothetical protein